MNISTSKWPYRCLAWQKVSGSELWKGKGAAGKCRNCGMWRGVYDHLGFHGKGAVCAQSHHSFHAITVDQDV